MMDAAYIIFCLIITVQNVKSDCDGNTYPSVEHELREKIFCNYDPDIRPVKFSNDKMNISAEFYLRHIDYDDATNILYADMMVGLEWEDAFLKWDPSQNNITYMNVHSDKLWMPDLTNYHNWFPGGGIIPLEPQSTVVTFEGSIYYFNTIEMPAHCAANIALWPHDSHVCTFSLSSRSYYSDTVEFLASHKWLFRVGVGDEYFENNKWDVKSVNAKVTEKYFGANQTYRFASIILTIDIGRHSSTLFSTITSPIVVLVVMLLSTFWIDPNEMYRAVFLLMSAAGHFTYLQYLGSKIPPSGSQPVVVVTFLRNSLILNWIAFIVHLSNKRRIQTKKQAPDWLTSLSSWVYSSNAGKYLYLNNDFEELKTDDEINLVADRAKNLEWILLATLIDRVCFIVYLMSYIIMIIIYVT